MSNTTPESPNGAHDHDLPEADNEVADWDNGVVDPPSDPIPATGHVSAPASPVTVETPAAPEPAAPEPAAPEPVAPEAVAYEPGLSTPDLNDTASVAPLAFSNQDLANTGSEPTGSATPASAPADVPPVAFTGDIPEAAHADRSAVGDLSSEPTSPGVPVAETATDSASETAAPTAVAAVVTEPGAEPLADTAGGSVAPDGAATVAAGAVVAGPTGNPPPNASFGQPVIPIYVSAPLPPKKKHNRTFGLVVSLIGTAVFAIIYAAVVAAIGLVQHASDNFLTDYTNYLGTASFYVPIIFFFVAMVLLILILNRAGWWAYIIGGFFVAVVVYFAFIGGALLQVAHRLTPAEVHRFVDTLWLNPFGIAGGIVAREVSIWIGLWLAARGRRLRVKNAEAREEYERTLQAGPQQNNYPPTA